MNETLAIAFVSSSGGGLDTYVLEAGRWLAGRGHTIHILYLQDKVPVKSERYAALHFHSVPSFRKPSYYVNRLDILKTQWAAVVRQFEGSLALAHYLRKLKADKGLDLVEVIEGFSFPFLFKSIPYVVKMHGAEWTVRHYCSDGRVLKVLIALETQALRSARQIYAVSRAHAAFIAGACNISPRLIQVIRYPSDLTQFRDASPPSSEPPFHLMNVGRLQRRKGTHTLIAALREVWLHEPDTHLHLYGSDGDFGREQIEQLINPEEHNGRIHFEGFVARETLIERYQQAHVYVAPTRYETSGGYHIQEALNCGRPVIAASSGSVSELVRHEETGWLFPRDDSDALARTIVYALRNPMERERYAVSARAFSQIFDADTIMNRQLALYRVALRS